MVAKMKKAHYAFRIGACYRCSTLLHKHKFASFLSLRRHAFAPELPIPSLQVNYTSFFHNVSNKMWDFINKYLSSENEFEIRFAVVMILDYYIEEKYLKDIFNIFDNLYLKNRSNQYYVQMAVAWAISICLVKFYDETLKYLEKSKIDKFTFNKSIQKAIESYRINKEQKDELKELIIR